MPGESVVFPMPGLITIAACVIWSSRRKRQFRSPVEKNLLPAGRQDSRRGREICGRDAGSKAEQVEHLRRLRRRIRVQFLKPDAGKKTEHVADLVHGECGKVVP